MTNLVNSFDSKGQGLEFARGEVPRLMERAGEIHEALRDYDDARLTLTNSFRRIEEPTGGDVFRRVQTASTAAHLAVKLLETTNSDEALRVVWHTVDTLEAVVDEYEALYQRECDSAVKAQIYSDCSPET